MASISQPKDIFKLNYGSTAYKVCVATTRNKFHAKKKSKKKNKRNLDHEIIIIFNDSIFF